MTIASNLKKAQDIILDPLHWTKGTAAREFHDGVSISPLSRKATCFCLIGAIASATQKMSEAYHPNIVGKTEEVTLLAGVIRSLRTGSQVGMDTSNVATITCFNDSGRTNHEQVLYVLDLAIQHAELAGV